MIQFLNPAGDARKGDDGLVKLPPSLDGLTIGLVDNSKPNAVFLLNWIADELETERGTSRIMDRKPASVVPVTPSAVTSMQSTCGLVVAALGD
jgi:hypothetical protein